MTSRRQSRLESAESRPVGHTDAIILSSAECKGYTFLLTPPGLKYKVVCKGFWAPNKVFVGKQANLNLQISSKYTLKLAEMC